MTNALTPLQYATYQITPVWPHPASCPARNGRMVYVSPSAAKMLTALRESHYAMVMGSVRLDAGTMGIV